MESVQSELKICQELLDELQVQSKFVAKVMQTIANKRITSNKIMDGEADQKNAMAKKTKEMQQWQQVGDEVFKEIRDIASKLLPNLTNSLLKGINEETENIHRIGSEIDAILKVQL
jgi:mevalonate kinase